MTIKTITISAESIQYGRLTIWQGEDCLNWSRDYHFLDGDGKPVAFPSQVEFGSGSFVSGQMPMADVPKSVLDALAIMDQYTKNQINAKEKL